MLVCVLLKPLDDWCCTPARSYCRLFVLIYLLFLDDHVGGGRPVGHNHNLNNTITTSQQLEFTVSSDIELNSSVPIRDKL